MYIWIGGIFIIYNIENGKKEYCIYTIIAYNFQKEFLHFHCNISYIENKIICPIFLNVIKITSIF